MKARNRNTLIATTLALALTAGAGTAFAWGGPQGPRDPADRFDYIFSELNLSEETADDVLEVMDNFRAEQRQAMQARRDSGAGRPSEEEFAAIRSQARTALSDQLGTVLSADQVDELMTYMDYHGPMMGAGRPGGRHYDDDHRGYGYGFDDDDDGRPGRYRDND